MKILLPVFLLLAQTVYLLGAEKPNLIIIMTDDHGYADVGFNGSTEIPTPHIDRIAQEGVRFTSGYVTYPVCGPSRAGLLTGRYQGRFGFRRNPTLNPFDPLAGLPLEEPIISEILGSVGYHSGIIGKWHMGTHPRFRPNKRGFDEFFGFLSGGHDYFPENLTYPDIESVDRAGRWYNTKLLRNEKRVEIDEYLTDELSKEAVKFVQRNQRKPFFLYLAYNAPHTPMQASEKYLKRFAHIEDEHRRTYAAMVSSVDDGVGMLLDTLDALNLSEKTLVFFLSDNGGAAYRINAANNAPFRSFKGQVFEGGVRVPFALRWKGAVPAGVDYNYPISALDILGTIADLAGVNIDPTRPLDGVNLIPYINGERNDPPHERLYWHMYDRDRSAILTSGGDKLVIMPEDGTRALYNLNNDLGETHDLSSQKRQKTDALEAELETWKAQMKPPFYDGLGTWQP